MKRALRRAKPKPKKTKPAPTVTLTMEQFRELVGLAKAAKPPAQPRVRSRAAPRDALPPAVPAKKLTHAEMRKRAVEAILGPMLVDVKAGKMDPEDLAFWEERRAEDIQAHIEGQKRPPRIPSCDDCERPSTTVMAGRPYCTEHARRYKQEMA